MNGSGASSWIILIMTVLIIIGIIKIISKGPANNPTWKGIIISAIFGMLPLYLICCFLGWMGEERNRY